MEGGRAFPVDGPACRKEQGHHRDMLPCVGEERAEVVSEGLPQPRAHDCEHELPRAEGCRSRRERFKGPVGTLPSLSERKSPRRLSGAWSTLSYGWPNLPPRQIQRSCWGRRQGQEHTSLLQCLWKFKKPRRWVLSCFP